MTRIAPIERATARMVLRGLVERDCAEFVRAVSGSRAAWAPWTPAAEPNLTDEESFRRELLRTERGLSAGTHLRLAGFAEDGALVGLFALNEIVRGAFERAYASWQVSDDRMGQGYGSEGVQALLDIAFDSPSEGLGLHRVQANVMPSNVASLRIAERAEFRREGVAARYLRIAGSWEDHIMHAVTVEDRGDTG